MYRYGLQFLVPLFLLAIFTACSEDKTSQKTLLLSLSADSSGFSVTDFKVLDQAFKKSHQQGNYQALLQDSEGNRLREITFQNIENPQSVEGNADLTVSIPFDENLHQISIFQLDGRSGHYRRTDESLVTWTLPDSVKERSKQTGSYY
jgi:hypothetical protein